jgi:hypothetical protein
MNDNRFGKMHRMDLVLPTVSNRKAWGGKTVDSAHADYQALMKLLVSLRAVKA